jgi:Fe-S-cluster containining protein
MHQPANLNTSDRSQILIVYKTALNVDNSVNKLFFRTIRAAAYICSIAAEQYHIETDPARVAELSIGKTAENDRFRSLLQQKETAELDKLVCSLNEQISPQIDCTACGNCCKSLMIVVSDEEADRLSSHLGQNRNAFDDQYLEKGAHGIMLINKIPCHFLKDNKCTVYEHRFAGCREFPALHVPGFNKRLFTVFMHYDRCPIIYNVVEQLKLELKFS